MAETEQKPRMWMSIPLQHLASKKYKVAFSIKELAQASNDFSKKYVGGCTPSLIKSEPKKLFMHYRVTCTKADSDPKGHEVRVQFDLSKIDTSSTINNLDVRVSCSCPAFLYWGAQWNLNSLDSLEGVPRPELKAPTEQLEKRDTYFICKHIKVVSDRITPAIGNVLNRIKDRLRLEKIRDDREQELADKKLRQQEQETKQQEPEKPQPQEQASPATPPKPKKPPVKPDRGHLDMGQSKPSRTRPGVIN
jgi:hypothetical protein